MSGFILATGKSDRSLGSNEQSSIAFTKKGMSQAGEIQGNGYLLKLFANHFHDPAKVASLGAERGFCTYVGTLIYRGRTGREATGAILQDTLRHGVECLDNAIGNFCALIDDGNQLHVVTDRAGLHHVYYDECRSIVTNSYIAAANAVPRKTFQTQEILEYILLGATFGRKTILQEISLQDPDECIQVHRGALEFVSRGDAWRNDGSWRSLTADQRLAQSLEAADDYYAQVAKAFGNRVTAALSGGYDSRLNLALLLSHGVKPSLFVYGAPTDVDVLIAKEISEGEQIQLVHLDRARQRTMAPDEYWSNQEHVFHGLDGLTQYGFACEPYEVSHRHERVAGGLIAINGGGGEIWRDFWKVRDRPMRADQFVKAYFSGRFSGLAHSINSPLGFLRVLAGKVEEQVGKDCTTLESPVVQSLYPRIRLRFWQGKNNSVDNHIGYALTPFSEHRFSFPAMWIPLSAKRDGWFERQMICRVSRSLARYPSSHGYDLEHGPGILERLKSFLSRNLPVFVRAARRRLSLRRRRFYFHSAAYIQARFGAGPLEVEKFVNMSQLGDALAFSRALTIERMLRGQW